jgi:hypothetical protein
LQYGDRHEVPPHLRPPADRGCYRSRRRASHLLGRLRRNLITGRPRGGRHPQCAAAFGQDGNVGAWVPANEGDGAAGTVYYPLEFTNISGHACSLFGYPGVSAVSSTGQQLGRPAGWGSLSGARRVVLAPGATAHTILAIHDVYSFTERVCDPVHAVGLRIYLPDQRLATSVAFSFEACSRAGVVYMGVDPILAGAGTIDG